MAAIATMARMQLWLGLLEIVIVISGTQCSNEENQCYEMVVPECKDVGYEMTSVNSSEQIELGRRVFQQFSILFKVGCSDSLRALVCSYYLPMCVQFAAHLRIGPCRTLCEEARSGCLRVMDTLDIPWPQELSCDRFPGEDGQELCVKRAEQTTTTTEIPARLGSDSPGESCEQTKRALKRSTRKLKKLHRKLEAQFLAMQNIIG